MSVANALVFGASGALGSAIVSDLVRHGFQVATAGSTSITRASVAPVHIQLAYDIPPQPEIFTSLPELQAVVWAQGLKVRWGEIEVTSTCYDEITTTNITNKQTNMMLKLVTSLQCWICANQVSNMLQHT